MAAEDQAAAAGGSEGEVTISSASWRGIAACRPVGVSDRVSECHIAINPSKL